VDAAGDGDIIKVAAGTYTDVHRRAGITQVVYVGNQGGGICSVRANPVIAGNVISGNVAGTAGYARGGGICLEGGTPSALITGNHVLHNVATTSAPDSGHGGGIYLNASAATVYSNTIQDNIANPNGWGLVVVSICTPALQSWR